jgi:hypothetical protein
MEHSGKWMWMFDKVHFIPMSFCLIKEKAIMKEGERERGRTEPVGHRWNAY